MCNYITMHNTKLMDYSSTWTYLYSAAVIILGFLDSSTFYCSSRDYVAAAQMGEETGYCVFVSEYSGL